MELTGRSVLITGGGSGIGLETAKRLAGLGNRVLITGRNEEKLKKAVTVADNLQYRVCDVTDAREVKALAAYVKAEYPDLSILMNNAGLAFLQQLEHHDNVFELASQEITTNYLSTINIITQLLPVLKQQPVAAIVNISSITSFAPAVSLPTYSASKAALHAYTQVLRIALSKTTGVKVFEVMPSLVDTDFAKDIPAVKITADEAADAIIAGLISDTYEMHVGETAGFHAAFFSESARALLVLNRLG